MSVNEKLSGLIGKWKGTNKLYLSPDPESLRQSDSTADVSLKSNGQFLGIEYTWSYEGKPQECLLVIGSDAKSNAAQVVWTDSWHMSHKFMVCDGQIEGDGAVDVKGYYRVPGHADWGWRTQIVPGDASFKLVMFNVSPGGEEELAVESGFVRA